MYNINNLDFQLSLKSHDIDQASLNITVTFKQKGDELELKFHSNDFSPFVNKPIFHNKRLDNLWKQTCFEFFISKTNGEYREYNFDINGNWQCYDFTSYRSAATTPQITVPVICWEPNHSITIKIKEILTTQINICAILKDRNNNIHYYSINRATTKNPDFHNKNDWLNLKVDGQYS